MKQFSILLFLFFIFFYSSHAQNRSAELSAFNKTDNEFFIENKGQWPIEVLFTSRIGGLDVWITKKGVLYDFYKLEEEVNETLEDALVHKFEHKNRTKYGHRVWHKYMGNNIHITMEGLQKQEAYYNFLIGNESKRHTVNVELYKEAIAKNVYNGIDVRYYFEGKSLRFDYLVQPGADPSQIKFTLEGTDKAFLSQDGNLVFSTRFGDVSLAELHTYQESKDNQVNSRFVKTENGWNISVGDYNVSQILIIDPLVYSTYLGGSDEDKGHAIAVDALGQAYITGRTLSLDFDTTAGSYQTNYVADDAFISKLNSTGTGLIYSTFLGGSGYDYGLAIDIDALGNAFVMGITGNLSNTFNDFPVTSGAFQTSHFGSQNTDVFVTKINTTGTALVYSTFLGGSEHEYGGGIAVNTSGEAYVTGRTLSLDFDTTAGAYQTSKFIYFTDAFISKFNSTGTALVYSTYLGGDSSSDVGHAIAIDATGNAYITGYTQSIDFPTTSGAFQINYNGGFSEAFVSKMNATGTDLIYSTFLGDSLNDQGNSIAVDASGHAYITGLTLSDNFPTTTGAFQTSFSGAVEVFVTKLNTSGTALIYSTFLGGNGWDGGDAIEIDAAGNACVAGRTNSLDFDTTAGAYQTSFATGFGYDAFISKLNTTGTNLIYSTYLGGNQNDNEPSLTIDASGIVYVSGSTSSTNFPTSSGAYQTSYGGGSYDAFVTKICLVEDATIDLSSVAGSDAQDVCINNPIADITYITTNATGATFNGLPSGVSGSWAANVATISGTPIVSGMFNYSVSLTRDCDSVSTSGSIKVGCVGINDAFDEDNIQLYPNPASSEVSIKGTFTTLFQLEVRDASGRSINANYSFDNETIRLNISSLTNGMYQIRIVDKGQVFHRKFMVLH